MGAGSSRKYFNSDGNQSNDYAILDAERKLQEKISVPLQVLVAHYTPSSFPLVPVIHRKNTELCRESWKKIVTTDVPDPYGGPTLSGITAFYSEFYDRLDVFDSAGKFDAILSQHVGSNSKIAAKGAILIRIVDFVSKITENNKQTQMVLYMLGKSHANKAIRPWQYSVFIQTLLNTISSRLGVDASSRVMESWVHLFAYVMQHMLPPAIDGRVVETEVNINTSSAFSEGNIAAEVQEAEEVRTLNRKLKSGSNSNASSVRSSIIVTNGAHDRAHDPTSSFRRKLGAINEGLSNGLPPKATTAADRYQ